MSNRLSVAVAATVVVMAGALGAIDGAAEAATAPLPTAPPKACATDEAVGPVCVWDARHQGDGNGRSFVHYRGEGHKFRVSHRTAHALLHRDNWQPVVGTGLLGKRMDDLNGKGTVRVGPSSIVSYGDTTYVQVGKGNAKPRHIAAS